MDRGNRRLIMMFADATVALATLILVILFLFQITQIWHIYALLFVRAVAGGLH